MDFDTDEAPDLLIGCFEGFVYLLPGKGPAKFGEPERLRDKEGNDIHLGEFWDYENSKWADDGETHDLGVYPKLVDWDADGDLDLLFGGYRGTLGIRINEGNAAAPAFATSFQFVEAGGEPLKIEGANSPDFVDWNADGLPDLVCAGSRGDLVWFKNTGEKGKPAFSKAVSLAEKTDDRPNSYLKLVADDYNADGKIDLIVGGYDKNRKPAIWLYLRD